jgi:hypothetical protein
MNERGGKEGRIMTYKEKAWEEGRKERREGGRK